MSIKDEELYPKYLIYLENKNTSNGGLELSKISAYHFEEFKVRYENSETFRKKVDNDFKMLDREGKIETIIESELFIFSEDDVKKQKFDFDF